MRRGRARRNLPSARSDSRLRRDALDYTLAMPIPMPPPPAPYVAPDLRPFAASDVARLLVVRDTRGRVREMNMDANVWIAVEGAPLEVRMHRRADGTAWAEQAFYAAGDRAGGIARVSAGAQVQGVSQRVAGTSLGSLRNVVRYTVRSEAGAVVRTWMGSQCGVGETSRLDRADSPEEPTYPSSFDDCGPFGGFGGGYVLGRIFGIDRGWAMRAQAQLPRGAAPIAAGRYTLQVELDPLEALGDADRSNQSITVPLVVRSVKSRFGDPIPLDPVLGPTISNPAPAASSGTRLRTLERVAEARDARAGKVGEPTGVDLPDLRQAPSYGIEAMSRTLKGGRQDVLMFGSLTWNAGPGRLEVEAFREQGEVLRAYQVFYRDGERAGREARGTLVWHAAPGHNHFHFHSFAHYSLTKMDGTVVRDAGKHSWCIVDTDVVDTTRPGVAAGDAGVSGGCGFDPGALWARLSLSVGAGDYYGPGTSGQTIDITGLPNGLYRIRLEANPSRVIAEANYDNNVSTRIIRIGGVHGNRRVFARPVPTIDDRGFGGPDDCDECTGAAG
jgi:hypothetical protein